MEENQVSLTSLVSAFARAYHFEHDDPIIFNDFLAKQLLPHEKFNLIDTNWAKAIAFFNPEKALKCTSEADALDWVMKTQCVPQTISRARYVEDCLEIAIQTGVKQYVILGAGLDTFAFRRKDLLDKINIYELDHPATQSFKKQRIQELGWTVPQTLHFVPVDFTKDNIIDVLSNSSFDNKLVSFFSWIGVVYYLPEEAILRTLQSISQFVPSGSSVIFDYLDDLAFKPDKASKRILQMQAITKQAGEPLVTGFNSSTLDLKLQIAELLLYENLTPQDIENRYFKGRNDDLHAFDHFHFANAVMKNC